MLKNIAPSKSGRGSRGIEPIVAAILLVIIATVAGVILYLWVSRLISSEIATTNGAPIVSQIQIMGIQVTKESKLYHIVMYARSQVPLSSKNIEAVMIYDTSGRLRGVIPNKDGYISVSNVVDDIYRIDIQINMTGNISSSLNHLEEGAYYCEIVTDYGTIITPVFVLTKST